MTDRDPNERIDELGSLSKGWLDGEGEEITSLAIGLSRILVSLLNPTIVQQTGIFPTEEGGIHFEFDVSGKMFYEINVEPTGDMTLWEFHMATNEDKELSFSEPQDLVVELQSMLSKTSKD